MHIAVFCGSSSPKKQTYIETMKKIMLLCAVLFTLAASAEAQGDTFYVHSVYHNGVVLYEEDWRENAEEWPAKYVVEDSSTFRFAQFEYKKIRLKGEPQEWIISDGCDDVGYDYVYEVEYNGKMSELEISKYRNEARNCCRSYGVDGYKFLVCPYPPDEKPLYDDNEIFTIVEDDPEFPGGMEALYKYLEENTKYPDGARCENGRVYVQFVVERDGSITNAHVLKDLCGGCEEEALRVVNSMPKWVPGFQRGKPVRVRFNLLVIFSKK